MRINLESSIKYLVDVKLYVCKSHFLPKLRFNICVFVLVTIGTRPVEVTRRYVAGHVYLFTYGRKVVSTWGKNQQQKKDINAEQLGGVSKVLGMSVPGKDDRTLIECKVFPYVRIMSDMNKGIIEEPINS